MPQHDMVIADAAGATVRADINSGLQALASTSKGASAPSTIYAGQHWIEDDSPSSNVWTEKVYDGTDSIPAARIDSTNNRYIPYNGPHGQCRLTKSGANLLLSPLNGNVLVINGAPEVIPSGGVTLSTSALAADTTYFIYAYMNSGTMTLEASATGHATDATNGVEIKSADATRSLVGMARTNGSTAWVDSAAQRFVSSWFNRRPIYGSAAFTTARTTTSATPTELNTETRAEFLTWITDAVAATAAGTYASTSAAVISASIGIDGTNNAPTNASNVNNEQRGYGVALATGLSEGYHYTTIFGATSAGTVSFGSGTNSVVVQG
jgi:hypothetical protein